MVMARRRSLVLCAISMATLTKAREHASFLLRLRLIIQPYILKTIIGRGPVLSGGPALLQRGPGRCARASYIERPSRVHGASGIKRLSGPHVETFWDGRTSGDVLYHHKRFEESTRGQPRRTKDRL